MGCWKTMTSVFTPNECDLVSPYVYTSVTSGYFLDKMRWDKVGWDDLRALLSGLKLMLMKQQVLLGFPTQWRDLIDGLPSTKSLDCLPPIKSLFRSSHVRFFMILSYFCLLRVNCELKQWPPSNCPDSLVGKVRFESCSSQDFMVSLSVRNCFRSGCNCHGLPSIKILLVRPHFPYKWFFMYSLSHREEGLTKQRTLFFFCYEIRLW